VIYFLFSYIVLIFRRLWIDVERLPFPIVFAGYSTIDALTTKDKGKIRSFLIGMIVALALELPIIFAGLFPWFPDISAWLQGGAPVPWGDWAPVIIWHWI
jgi:hypothetical protein